MSPLLFLAIALAGGLGSVCRLLLDGLVRGRTRGSFPWGTVVINLTGSFALGLVTGIASAHLLPPEWQLVIATGFLGGYTTFSTASYETVRLLQEGRWRASLVNGLGVIVVTTGLAACGLWIGSLFG